MHPADLSDAPARPAARRAAQPRLMSGEATSRPKGIAAERMDELGVVVEVALAYTGDAVEAVESPLLKETSHHRTVIDGCVRLRHAMA